MGFDHIFGRRIFSRTMAAALFLSGLILPSGLSPAQAGSAQPVGLDLSQYRGKVVYLDFWASWCGPCKLSFGFMDQLRRSYADKDLAIITVNLDHDRAAAASFLRQVGSPLPVIYDPKGHIAERYRLSAMPTTVLFDRNGRQIFVHRGYFDNKAQDYAHDVASLVAAHY